MEERGWMMEAEQIVKLILDAARESRVLTGGVYKDEPIIRTGRQAYGQHSTGPRRKRRGASSLWELAGSLAELVSEATTPTPHAISNMRALARNRSGRVSAYADPQLFYDQARLMEGYEDDCLYEGTFQRYYPTYEDMTDAQLRGYFTWRTRYRAGEAPEASLSFLFVYAYELLCGVGAASPADALAALARLRDTYGQLPGNGALQSYLTTWMSDLAIYHGLGRSLLGANAEGSALERAVAVLDGAERALLASAAPGQWDASASGLPLGEDFVSALAAASRYRLERSRVFSDRSDELAECCCAVFARMVDHCHRRRKRGFVDGLFGDAVDEPYAMFRSAVFHDPVRHPDCTVELMSGVRYRCRAGSWSRYRPHRSSEASAELGDILHEIDRVLRLRLGGLPELKEREVPKYVRPSSLRRSRAASTAVPQRRPPAFISTALPSASSAPRTSARARPCSSTRSARIRSRILRSSRRPRCPRPLHRPHLRVFPRKTRPICGRCSTACPPRLRAACRRSPPTASTRRSSTSSETP